MIFTVGPKTRVKKETEGNLLPVSMKDRRQHVILFYVVCMIFSDIIVLVHFVVRHLYKY